jgi:hypothetical protein
MPIISERETGFEPATSTLARSHSTAELFPHILIIMKNFKNVKFFPENTKESLLDGDSPKRGWKGGFF